MTEKNCCICLEKKDAFCYTCYTCKEGLVCYDCISGFDPVGSIYLSKREDILDVIKCPCCRVLNWKYHHHSLIQQYLIWDLYMYSPEKNNALNIFIKNFIQRDDCGFVIDKGECSKCLVNLDNDEYNYNLQTRLENNYWLCNSCMDVDSESDKD